MKTNNKQQTIEKVLLATLFIGIIAGCEDNTNTEPPNMSNKLDSSYVLDIYSMEGHKYITYINGGLVHAESCECKNKGGQK
jgi:hypothetical protein